MAAGRKSMRQIRDILRQKWAWGSATRAVAQSLGVGLRTVSSVVSRAQARGWTGLRSIKPRLALSPARIGCVTSRRAL
jgi:transposase